MPKPKATPVTNIYDVRAWRHTRCKRRVPGRRVSRLLRRQLVELSRSRILPTDARCHLRSMAAGLFWVLCCGTGPRGWSSNLGLSRNDNQHNQKAKSYCSIQFEADPVFRQESGCVCEFPTRTWNCFCASERSAQTPAAYLRSSGAGAWQGGAGTKVAG